MANVKFVLGDHGLTGQRPRLSLEEIPTNPNASESQKCKVHVWPFFIPQAQVAKLIRPCEGAFHNPAPWFDQIPERIRTEHASHVKVQQ